MRVGGGADGNKARTYNINDMSVTDSRVTPDKFDQIRVGGGADGNRPRNIYTEDVSQMRVGGGADGANPRGYDLAELRRKLEQRMEYSKVNKIPHDPAMDPDDTVPSYASSNVNEQLREANEAISFQQSNERIQPHQISMSMLDVEQSRDDI